MTDQLFERQKKIYPQRIWGKYRIIKWLTIIILFAIYYLAPFIRWDRGPLAPDQAILIDITNSRAYFFFIEIWPQEVYFLTGILIFSAIALFFVTGLFGRVWCGYACPQTVWTDLFVWVERLIQGRRNTRIKLDNSPLSLKKIWQKLLTHIIWIIISLATGGAWVLYFNDAPTLVENMIHLNIPWSVSSWIFGLAGSTYIMAGFAREQVCTYMCPYARFQSAMFDEDTLLITYDKKRGEKRGKHKKGESWEGKGHCVDCSQCVVVCPQGIDIRNGLQMECITCGLCIDACNGVMDKLGLERGLIRYDTERNALSDKKSFRIIRPRTIYYSIVIAIIGGVMLYGLLNRSLLEIHILHDRNPIFTVLSSGKIRNGYNIKIMNKTHSDKEYSLKIKGLKYSEVKIQGVGEIKQSKLPVFANTVGNFRLFVVSNKEKQSKREITFELKDNKTGLIDIRDSVFINK